MSHAFKRHKQHESAKATRTGTQHHGERDPIEGHTFKDSQHGKPVAHVGGTNYPVKNLIKEYTQYCDNRFKVDNGNFSTVFLTSQYFDFELTSLNVQVAQKAVMYFTLINTSATDWVLPNLWFLIDRVQILWNGQDAEDSWYGWHLKEMNQLFARNIETTAREMHFHPPSSGEGLAFLPRNQAVLTQTSATTAPDGIAYTGTASYPLGIPSKEPLVVPAGQTASFELDLTGLPLFSGHLYFPALEGRKTRLRVYMNATDSIIGESTYLNTGTNKVDLIAARAANQLQLLNCELRLHGHRFTVGAIREELHRTHSTSFSFKCLIPQRIFYSNSCTTGVEVGEERRIQGMKGVFALWTLMIRDNDCEYAAGKQEWVDSITNLTEVYGDGTVRDYEKKDASLFSNLVDEVRFTGGNNYFTLHADFGQFMRADPFNRGSVNGTTGASRTIGADATATKPYYHKYGKNKRILTLCFSSQPLKDYWWGTQYGGEYHDGDKVVKFTPGVSYFDFPFVSTTKNFWITGYRYVTIACTGGDDILVIKQ